MGQTQKIRGIVTGTLVFLYLFSVLNFTVFTHTHYSPDGTVTHSHPYKSASHTHSSAEFHFIPDSGSFIALVSAVSAILFAEIFLREINSFFQGRFITGCRYISSPRAPPVLSFRIDCQ